MLDVDFAHLSDRGKVRDNNEDYVGHCRPATLEEGRSHGWLFVLADGVGGHDRGEVASRAAVEHMLEAFPKAPAGEPPSALLTRLIREANVHVYELAKKTGAGGSSMSTTVVACALRFDRAVVAHAGDSRCYLVRQGEALQLTRDHTVAQDQAALGIRPAGEAATRHVLSRSLGSDLFLNVDVTEPQLLPDDVLVLCCDGVHNALLPVDIATIASPGANLDNAARRIVNLANERDGSDNISVQLIRIRSVERVGMYRGRPYKLR